MRKSFGELVADGINRIDGMDPMVLATRVGLSRNRIYQVLEGQGGVPRRWWQITDALGIDRTEALMSFPDGQAPQALAYLTSSGERDSVLKETIERIEALGVSAKRTAGPDLSNVAYIGITPTQCRTARALLGWSQYDLERASSVSQSTISHYESGAQSLILATQNLIWAAFADAGVRILNPGDTTDGGEGVRFEK